MKLKSLLVVSLLVLFISPLRADEGAAERGKIVFTQHCARCHGMDAKGNGPDAKRLTIVPRDLTSGVFKFKSTAYGTPPSDDDLVNGIIGHGLGGSGMPSFGNLNEKVRKDLVAYIKTVSPAFQTGLAPQPIPNPGNFKSNADLQKGKQVYETMQCGLCHGANGHANGTSAFTLVDKWQRPIRVANLTQGWTYRGGSRPIDIYHRILAGIEGAPMPSYEGAASHEDIWQLCQYVASLQLKTNWSNALRAAKVNGALPTKSDDALWDSAPRTDVNMQSFVYDGENRAHLTVNAVSVQALTNDSSVAFRVFWEDPVQDVGTPSDALLMAIKPTDFSGDVRANLHTLYASDAPLDVTLWQASLPKSTGQKKTSVSSARPGWMPTNILDSVSSYSDGRWTVMFDRALELDGAQKLEVGHSYYIGFTAWDGHNKETGQRRSASQWIRLELGSEKHHN